MSMPPILAAGLDGRSLLLEAPLLQRERRDIQEVAGGRALLDEVVRTRARLVVLGPRLPDLELGALVKRIREYPGTRHVSVLVLLPAQEPADAETALRLAGANGILRRPLQAGQLESWVAKLLAVPRRVEARIPVQAQVVGTPRAGGAHFYGLTHNLSTNGLLLASPVPLEGAPDLDLELTVPGLGRLTLIGRVVREAPEVAWPYMGYGVEFLVVPPGSLEAIETLIALEPTVTGPVSTARLGIHCTVRRDDWVYEILEPVRSEERWQSEIRRSPRDRWRPGIAGPYYVVEGDSPEKALLEARAFVARKA